MWYFTSHQRDFSAHAMILQAPMMEFIDTHCDVFTGEDENKFEHRCGQVNVSAVASPSCCLTVCHSALHQAYVELSMSLIESFLQDIGISAETFAAGACFALLKYTCSFFTPCNFSL